MGVVYGGMLFSYVSQHVEGVWSTETTAGRAARCGDMTKNQDGSHSRSTPSSQYHTSTYFLRANEVCFWHRQSVCANSGGASLRRATKGSAASHMLRDKINARLMGVQYTSACLHSGVCLENVSGA